MILFPAIDLIDGKVVRLERGDRNRMTVYSDDPVAVAHSFSEAGARWVHVVDLSAAFEEDEGAQSANLKAIRSICAIDRLSVDVGGGVRTLARIDQLGSAGQVKVNGWRDGIGRSAADVVSELAGLGFRHLVFTDIARDGMQTGIDVDAYRAIARIAGFPVVASGGISTLDDVRSLAAAGDDVIEGAITGRALYEGAFALDQALAAASGR